ncbi:hypothetical protein LguiB_022628 [Lonicera macranthoides]
MGRKRRYIYDSPSGHQSKDAKYAPEGSANPAGCESGAGVAPIRHQNGDDEKCAKNILEEDEERSKLVNKNSNSKKGRHSKIDTPKGPREQRMRLPVDVTPRFLGLQDLLSFNKPRRIVEWLLTNSKSAIKQ